MTIYKSLRYDGLATDNQFCQQSSLVYDSFRMSTASTNTIDTAKLALISQGSAYGLLIGLSVVFCGVILIAVKVQKVYLSEDSGKSEMFMVANRSVGTGLTASAVFSSWMWINETVLAAAMCYRYGLAIPLVRASR